MNKVREFLEKGDYTFDEGVAVLLAFSSNEGVNSYITSSRNIRHLHYELARLARYPRLEPIPGRKLPGFLLEKAEVETRNVVQKDEKIEKASADETPSDTETEEDETTFLTLEHHKYTRLEDMRTPLARELWVKNRDEYDELKHCHQMMKEANSDAGRADWRKKVHKLSQSLKDRWKLIDEENRRFDDEQSGKADMHPSKDFSPITCRSYISKALKKPEWDDKTKVEVQHRVDLLVRNRQAIGDDTKQRLRERGIAID